MPCLLWLFIDQSLIQLRFLKDWVVSYFCGYFTNNPTWDLIHVLVLSTGLTIMKLLFTHTTIMTMTKLQPILCGWPSISNKCEIYTKYLKFCTIWIPLAQHKFYFVIRKNCTFRSFSMMLKFFWDISWENRISNSNISKTFTLKHGMEWHTFSCSD